MVGSNARCGFGIWVLLIALLVGSVFTTVLAANSSVTIAINPGGSYQTMHDILLPEFQAAHPEIDLRIEYAGGLGEQIPIRHAAGTAPDVYILSTYVVPQYIADDMIAPVDPRVFGASSHEELASQYVPGVDNLLLHDGKAYWIPLEVNSFGLYYNPDHFAEAGVAEAPGTWDEIADLVKRLDARKSDPDAKTSITWQAGGYWPTRWWITFLRQQGVEWLNQDGTPQFDHPVALDAIETYSEFFASRTPSTSWQDIANGESSLLPGALFQMFHILRTESGVRPAVAPFPTFEEGERSSPSYAAGWVVSSQSENPEAAWELVKFLSSAQQTARWWQEVLLLQPRRGDWVTEIQQENPWIQPFLDEFQHARLDIYHPKYIDVRNAINRANTAVLERSMDTRAILETLQSEVSAAVQE